ncbi:MAG: ABC transporter ATP-binding protein [Rhodoglobus sp.]
MTGTGRSPQGRTSLVELVAVARTYRAGRVAVVAVHDADARVLPGDRIAITGSSGSGKSTLLHLLAGLDHPTSGTVSWPGLDIHPNTRRPGPAAIGLVFQGPSLLPPLDVLRNVALPLLLSGLDEPTAMERARQALATTELTHLGARLPEELSGGQAQRVAIARVVATRPPLILADEPTGQLDHASAEHVLDILFTAADHIGAAVIMTTHDPAVARRCTQHWTMHDGRLSTTPPPPGAADPATVGSQGPATGVRVQR